MTGGEYCSLAQKVVFIFHNFIKLVLNLSELTKNGNNQNHRNLKKRPTNPL